VVSASNLETSTMFHSAFRSFILIASFALLALPAMAQHSTPADPYATVDEQEDSSPQADDEATSQRPSATVWVFGRCERRCHAAVALLDQHGYDADWGAALLDPQAWSDAVAAVDTIDPGALPTEGPVVAIDACDGFQLVGLDELDRVIRANETCPEAEDADPR
jgi:hypothetical protein